MSNTKIMFVQKKPTFASITFSNNKCFGIGNLYVDTSEQAIEITILLGSNKWDAIASAINRRIVFDIPKM